MNMKLTADEAEIRRLQRQRQLPPAGIAPAGMPGAPGQPARPAPMAAGGIAPPPKYGSMDYVRPDGSRRVVDEAGERNLSAVPGVGLVAVPSATPMAVTPNRETNVTPLPTGGGPLDPQAGAVRTAPATGAQVQMPAEAWRRYDAANAARRAGIAPQLPVQPGDQPGGTNAYARAAGLFAGSTQRPGMVSEGGGRLAEIQKQREAEMDRSRYGLMRPGATSANNRAWDAARRDEARAADRRGMVEGQQSVDREGHQLAAAASVAGSLFKSQAEQAAAREAGGAARDVAGKNLEGVKYKADKDAETELTKSEREAAVRREEADRDRALKMHELDMRYGQDKSRMSDADLGAIVGKDGVAIRAARAAMAQTYHKDPEKNEKLRRAALDALAVQYYGKGARADYLESLVGALGPYVDLQDQRAGVQGAGAAARPGSKWKRRPSR